MIQRVAELREETQGLTITMLSEQLKTPRTSFNKILMGGSALNLNTQSSPTRRRCKNGNNFSVENSLNEWFAFLTARDVRINGPVLLEKAGEFAIKLGTPDFLPSIGLLSRWKKRKNIVYKNTCCDKDSANIIAADECERTKLEKLLCKFDEEDSFNADATDLHHRATLDGFLTYKYQSNSGYKKVMDRVTLL